MAGYTYSFKSEKENIAKCLGLSLPISMKQSVEICDTLRGKKLSRAKKILQDVIDMKVAMKYYRYNRGIGHKKGVGPGRYPIKASMNILKLLESAESNAQFKGLNTNSLEIIHISAQQASKQWKHGRFSRRKAKRTNIEVVVEEIEKSAKDEKKAKKGNSPKAHDSHPHADSKEQKHNVEDSGHSGHKHEKKADAQ
jgi:large subunit ribosomal protein L22